jgi:hypothetical protein
MAIDIAALKSWETTITFFSCVCGFILGLPMTTVVSMVMRWDLPRIRRPLPVTIKNRPNKQRDSYQDRLLKEQRTVEAE